MSQHLPIRIARPLRRQCAFQWTSKRPFSAAVALQADSPVGTEFMRHNLEKMEGQKAPSVVRAESMQTGDGVQDDIGMLPGTFIRTWDATPPLFPSTFSRSAMRSTLSKRWKFERTYLKTRIADLWQMLYYKWYARRPSIKRRAKHVFYQPEVKILAKKYYERLNEAFAKKQQSRLSNFCATGLTQDLRTRISNRSPNTKMTWELLSYKPSLPIPIFDIFANPRVVSNRMAHLPVPGSESRDRPTILRQVVLRISSKQRLSVFSQDSSSNSPLSNSERIRKLKWTPDGEQLQPEQDVVLKPEIHEKDVVEYLVLQRQMLRGHEEEWKVWGFAEPTTLEGIYKAEEVERQTLEYNAANPSLSG